MNLAVGFVCPGCGQVQADLLEIERDQNADLLAFRLHCSCCETVFRELIQVGEAVPARRSAG
jgi:predicted RNA-binding Zn-ribbon protein involved in translation (DUF1610 family)